MTPGGGSQQLDEQCWATDAEESPRSRYFDSHLLFSDVEGHRGRQSSQGRSGGAFRLIDFGFKELRICTGSAEDA